jgi:hemerythrin-like metal-binding domain
MLITWKDSFSCGITEIDAQHKKLFEIAGRIYDISTQRREVDKFDEINEVIEELKDYTVMHFKYEEKLMQQYGYEDYDNQKVEHDFFVKKIQRIEKKDLENEQTEAVVDMISFVTDWISSHILKSDKKYVEFFLSKGLH